MKSLDKKLLRDLRRLWAPSLAVALVVAAGVATLIMGVGTYRSLFATRAVFYERYDFGELFAGVKRAPQALAQRIGEMEGVAALETGIHEFALLDLTGIVEPVRAQVISLPDGRRPRLNRLYLRAGRLPAPHSTTEVVVNEPFATANGFLPGARFEALMNGRQRTLEICGIALSPEFVYAISPGDLIPDNRRYGILWMSESTLEEIYDLEGAFNSLSLRLWKSRDAPALAERVMQRLDRLLEDYGGYASYGRDQQISHSFLDAELEQLKMMGQILPPIFLLVSVFLLHMILARRVILERSQIGLLKALGFGDAQIAAHYIKFVLLITLVGALIGIAGGIWMGRGMTRLYGEFYRFPFLVFQNTPGVIVLGFAVALLAALAGALRAVLSVVRLPAVVAMAPPVPPRYRRLWRGGSFLPQTLTMSVRGILRRPLRTTLSCLGLACPVALMVASFFPMDAMERVINHSYYRAERQDATLSFVVERPERAVFAARQLPGVMHAEPYRIAPVILRHGRHKKRTAVIGRPAETRLTRIIDAQDRPRDLPGHGIVLSQKLAALLHVVAGDALRVEALDGHRRHFSVVVSDVVQGYLGLGAYMDLRLLNRALGDGDLVSGAYLDLDEADEIPLHRKVKQLPTVNGMALRRIAVESFRNTLRENIFIMTIINVLLCGVIAFGVVYNTVRIQLSERERELASLRVLGFTRGELLRILVFELAFISLVAVPVGWLFGSLLAYGMVLGFDNDLYRLPFHISRQTYGWAALVVLASSLLCCHTIWRRIRHLDLISVLKTRE